MSELTVCIAEDRAGEADAVRLLLASLQRYLPANVRVDLYFSPADDAFRQWLTAMPQVTLITDPRFAGHGWNGKPIVMLDVLERRGGSACWIDSDILAARDLSSLFAGLTRSTLLVTREPWFIKGITGEARCRAWGFKPGRAMTHTLNSGVFLCPAAHRGLLEAWRDAMSSEAYVAAQAMPFDERPWHMRGDQDVLTALLCSARFASLPLRLLESGPDIIQYSSPAAFGPVSRLRHLFGPGPFFIHAMRRKPWRGREETGFGDLLNETSPYRNFGRRLRGGAGASMDWADRATLTGRAMNLFGLHWALGGLPLSLLDGAFRLIRALRPSRG